MKTNVYALAAQHGRSNCHRLERQLPDVPDS
jgi:hypothetical protein